MLIYKRKPLIKRAWRERATPRRPKEIGQNTCQAEFVPLFIGAFAERRKTRHPQARRISPIDIATCLKIDKAYCKIFINDEVFWINIHQGNARAMNCIQEAQHLSSNYQGSLGIAKSIVLSKTKRIITGNPRLQSDPGTIFLDQKFVSANCLIRVVRGNPLNSLQSDEHRPLMP